MNKRKYVLFNVLSMVCLFVLLGSIYMFNMMNSGANTKLISISIIVIVYFSWNKLIGKVKKKLFPDIVAKELLDNNDELNRTIRNMAANNTLKLTQIILGIVFIILVLLDCRPYDDIVFSVSIFIDIVQYINVKKLERKYL